MASPLAKLSLKRYQVSVLIFDPHTNTVIKWKKIKFYQDAILDIYQECAVYYKGTTNPLDVYVIADKENNHFPTADAGLGG